MLNAALLRLIRSALVSHGLPEDAADTVLEMIRQQKASDELRSFEAGSAWCQRLARYLTLVQLGHQAPPDVFRTRYEHNYALIIAAMGAAVFELFRGSLYLAVDATLAGTAVSAPAAPVPSTTFSSLDQIVARGTIPPRPSRPDGSLVLNTKCQTLTRLSRYLGVRYLHPHEITSTDEQLLGTILTKFRRVLLEHMYFLLGYDRLEDAADDSKTYRGEYIRSLITQAEYGIMAAVRLRPQPFAICPMNESFYIERQDVLKPELIWLPRGNS